MSRLGFIRRQQPMRANCHLKRNTRIVSIRENRSSISYESLFRTFSLHHKWFYDGMGAPWRHGSIINTIYTIYTIIIYFPFFMGFNKTTNSHLFKAINQPTISKSIDWYWESSPARLGFIWLVSDCSNYLNASFSWLYSKRILVLFQKYCILYNAWIS